MIIYNTNGLSVHQLIKALRSHPDAVANTTTVNRFSQEEKKHFFSCPNDQQLKYTATDNEGKEMTWLYWIEERPSNLPNCDAPRYYLYNFHADKLVQKLHLKTFRNGAFYFDRHSYRHLYNSQCQSRRNRVFSFHKFNDKIDRLYDSKKKLRLKYKGKPTRTAKRIDYLHERSDHYQQLADAELMRFIGRYGTL